MSGQCGGSCSGDPCDKDKCKEKDLPCTCSDDEYDAGTATGEGFSEHCPYHKQWREKRKKGRYL